MTEVTRILDAIHAGEPHAAGELLPLVYNELRRLAAQKLAHEKPGQTMSATSLVHEAYLRLVGPADETQWNSRGHFFAAAAEAMRRILIEAARYKKSRKHGSEWQRVDLDDVVLVTTLPPDDLLALNDAIDALAVHDPIAAELVKVLYFAGLSVERRAESNSRDANR